MHYVKAKAILSSSNGINVYRGCVHTGVFIAMLGVTVIGFHTILRILK